MYIYSLRNSNTFLDFQLYFSLIHLIGEKWEKPKERAKYFLYSTKDMSCLMFVSSSWTTCWIKDTRSWTLWSSSLLPTLCWSAGSVAGRSLHERELNIQDQRKDSICFISQWFMISQDGACTSSSSFCLCVKSTRAGRLIHVNRRVWDSEIMLEKSGAWKHAINRKGGLRGVWRASSGWKVTVWILKEDDASVHDAVCWIPKLLSAWLYFSTVCWDANYSGKETHV